MKEPSPGVKIGVVAGFFVSAFALTWLALIPVNLPSVVDRLGFFCAYCCAAGGVMFCWGAIAAYVARKHNWSPVACFAVGASLFAIPGLAWPIFHSQPFAGRGIILLSMANFAGIVCRRLAYPELSDEQATAPPPPLTLFPK